MRERERQNYDDDIKQEKEKNVHSEKKIKKKEAKKEGKKKYIDRKSSRQKK